MNRKRRKYEDRTMSAASVSRPLLAFSFNSRLNSRLVKKYIDDSQTKSRSCVKRLNIRFSLVTHITIITLSYDNLTTNKQAFLSNRFLFRMMGETFKISFLVVIRSKRLRRNLTWDGFEGVLHASLCRSNIIRLTEITVLYGACIKIMFFKTINDPVFKIICGPKNINTIDCHYWMYKFMDTSRTNIILFQW